LPQHITQEQIDKWLAKHNLADMDAFAEHVRQVTRNHRICLEAVLGITRRELTELGEGSSRLVADIARDHQHKSPVSIVEKILRKPGELSLGNFAAEIDDLVRFRILCNYLGDVERVVERLAASQTLLRDFDIVSSEDRIWEVRLPVEDALQEDRRRRLRLSGVRAHYFVFESRRFREVKMEVQVATLLEHAWDQKDHHLVYEPERTGEPIPDRFRLRVKAVSDLLYVADEFLEVLRREREGGQA